MTTEEHIAAEEKNSRYSVTHDQARDIVERIKAEDQTGAEDLYKATKYSFRYWLRHCVGPNFHEADAEDIYHETLIIVINSIRRGMLEDSSRLIGFFRTVIHRQMLNRIYTNMKAFTSHVDIASCHDDESTITHTSVSDSNPEEAFIKNQHKQLFQDALKRLSRRDAEIITRFYLNEQSEATIREEMNLTQTQYRLNKSRALAKFGEHARGIMEGKPAQTISIHRARNAKNATYKKRTAFAKAA